MTPEQSERVAALLAAGYSARGASDALRAEGITLGKSAVNEEFRRLRSNAPAPTYTPRAPSPPPPQRAPKTPDPLPPLDVDELAERNPERLAERDWRWYEEEILRVRGLARRMFENSEFKHYNDLLAKAEKLERRAKELRPIAPPNPDKDPTYRAEARRLENYLEALITAAEQGHPIPERTLPPTKPIAT